MLRKWNNFKLYLRERLRITSKIEFTYPGKYLVKRRKYEDFVTVKNFENKLELKAKKDLEKLKKEPEINSLTLTELENYRESSKESELKDKKSDVYQKILIEGVQKYATLVTIRVHENLSKNFPEFLLHPEVMKKLEILEYHLNYNLPVDKRIVFETVPELFVHEIGQLEREERMKYSIRQVSFEPTGGIITRDIQSHNNLLNEYDTMCKIREMEMYVGNQLKDWVVRFAPFIQKKLDEGYESAIQYWKFVQIKEEKNMTFIEKLMLKEFKEHLQILEDIEALKISYDKIKDPVIMCFPVEGKMKEEIERIYNHVLKYETFNINDTMLVPHGILGESFDERLKRIQGFDVEELKRQSAQEYNFIANQNKPMKHKDLNVKDMDLIKKVNIISQAVKVQEPKLLTSNLQYELPADYLEETLLGDMPTNGRILVEEYFRVLHLNNENSEKYNMPYWENYFKVDKQTLRNIFNYVYFPLPDEKNKEEVSKVLYFQDFEYAKRRKLIEDMTSEEYKEYLEKTEERPEIQETKRLEYLEFQQMDQPRITEKTIAYDDYELDEQMTYPLKYSPIMKEIEERIGEFTENKLNVQLLDQDVVKKLENQNKQENEVKKEE